jgi:hypothetical protein
VTVPSARDFTAWAVGEKRPNPWPVEPWKEALNVETAFDQPQRSMISKRRVWKGIGRHSSGDSVRSPTSLQLFVFSVAKLLFKAEWFF